MNSFALWTAGGLLALVMGALRVAGAPTIVLKLDDLTDAPYAREGFDRVAHLLAERKIPASFGLMTESCADNGHKADYYALIRRWATTGEIEIWHHGWDHARGEFKDASEAVQREHLQRGCAVVQEKLGITLHTFGAPFDEIDDSTITAMNATPQLNVWFARPVRAPTNAVLLSNRSRLESRVGVIDYDGFVASFKKNAGKPYLVLTAHPPYWKDESFVAFSRVLAFCVQAGCRFVTPTQMAAELRNERADGAEKTLPAGRRD